MIMMVLLLARQRDVLPIIMELLWRVLIFLLLHSAFMTFLVYGEASSGSEDVSSQWGPWEPWTCGRTCGGGREVRVRQCEVDVEGRQVVLCPGPHVEERGLCHVMDCPGTTPAERQLMARVDLLLETSLSHVHHQHMVVANDSLTLNCSHPALNLLAANYSDLTLDWLHNGQDVVLDPEHMVLEDTMLYIPQALPRDTGVYTCEVYFHDEQSRTISVHAVAVTSETPTQYNPLGQPLSLPCHAGPLALLVDDLQMVWYHEDYVYYEFKEAVFVRDDPVLVDLLTEKGLGVWYCEITHPASGRAWMTNWFRVGEAPPTPPAVSTVGSILITVLCVVVVVIVVIVVYRWVGPEKRRSLLIRFWECVAGLHRRPSAVPLLAQDAGYIVVDLDDEGEIVVSVWDQDGTRSRPGSDLETSLSSGSERHRPGSNRGISSTGGIERPQRDGKDRKEA